MEIPVLRGLPVIGNLFDFRYRRLALQRRVVDRCGDIAWVAMGPAPTMLFVSSAALAREALTTHSRTLVPNRRFVELVRPLVGNGLFTSEPELYSRQRRLLAPAFTPARVAGYVEAIGATAAAAIARWRDGERIDLAAAAARLTLEITCKVLFDATPREVARVRGAVTAGLRAVERTLSSPPGPPWSTLGALRLACAAGALRRVVDGILAGHRGADRGDVLSLLVGARATPDGAYLSNQLIRDEVLTLLIAGHETVASALAWTLSLLASHPAALLRVQGEAERVVGAGLPTAEALPQLRYTLAAVKEALRLFPPAYLGALEAAEAIELGGHRVPAGSWVWINFFAIHRRRDCFAAADRFVPERFVELSDAAARELGFLPFGVGPRACIGKHLALAELQLLVALFVQRVALTPPVAALPVTPEPLMTLRPSAMPMIVRHRGQLRAACSARPRPGT